MGFVVEIGANRDSNMKTLPRFIVVVHAKSPYQALQQSKIAFDNGAGGIFLINHRIKAYKLLDCYTLVRSNYPDSFIGINFLDLYNFSGIRNLPEDCDALWMDQPQVHSDIPPNVANQISDYANHSGQGKTWRMFASVAFKYQMHEPRPEWAAEKASELFDVVVTSGAATGSPPEVDKIRVMYEAMNRNPLALASGVDAQNVKDYLPYVSCFMVATSISNEDDTLNPEKVRELADLIKN
jgi:phosphoribosylanthranilate isomerase